MGDPILKAMHGGIVNVCLSDPATGAWLSRLGLRQDNSIAKAMQIEIDVLCDSKEHVKTLTVAELQEALIAAAKAAR
ncbi:hypothetical protein ACDY96_17825 [Rhizobium mongolense]|uniref:hypothetical protein n=1 Tax=Rhizobium mongolense TaxID=57676 RepID=UPI0035567980